MNTRPVRKDGGNAEPNKERNSMEETLGKLSAYVVKLKEGYEKLLDAYPWEDFYRGAIEACEDIEEEIKSL